MVCMNVVIVLAAAFVIFWTAVAVIFKREVKAIFASDPAASNLLEVLFTYSGLHAMVFYRTAHAL